MDNSIESYLSGDFHKNLFSGLPREKLAQLFDPKNFHLFKKGELILKQGLKTNYLIYLIKGKVKFFYEDESGKGLILTIDKAPTLLGLANILNEDINAFSIYAIEDCLGCLIDINRLKIMIINHREFMLNVMKLSTSMFRKSIFNFISLANKQVNGRISDILLYLSNSIYESSVFELTLSRQEIAEFAGCSKENIIHTLRKFDSDGIIRLKGKKIEILDMKRLTQISRNG